MSGYDIFFLVIGTAAVLYACLFNRSKKATERDVAANVLRKADFPWLALLVLLVQLPIFALSFFSAIREQAISIWGFMGILLVASAWGVLMGRMIEWGKQYGREAPDSEEAREVSSSNQPAEPKLS